MTRSIELIFYENSPEAQKAKIDVPLAIKSHTYGCPHYEVSGFVNLDPVGKCLLARHKENQGINIYTKTGNKVDLFGTPHDEIRSIYSIGDTLYMEAIHEATEDMPTGIYLSDGRLAYGSPHFIISDQRFFGLEYLIRAVNVNGGHPRHYTHDGYSLTDNDNVLKQVMSTSRVFTKVGLREEFFATYATIESFIVDDEAGNYLFTTKTSLFPAIRKAALSISAKFKGDERKVKLKSFLKQIRDKIIKEPESFTAYMRQIA
jgi:hypothetical protein